MVCLYRRAETVVKLQSGLTQPRTHWPQQVLQISLISHLHSKQTCMLVPDPTPRWHFGSHRITDQPQHYNHWPEVKNIDHLVAMQCAAGEPYLPPEHVSRQLRLCINTKSSAFTIVEGFCSFYIRSNVHWKHIFKLQQNNHHIKTLKWLISWVPSVKMWSLIMEKLYICCILAIYTMPEFFSLPLSCCLSFSNSYEHTAERASWVLSARTHCICETGGTCNTFKKMKIASGSCSLNSGTKCVDLNQEYDICLLFRCQQCIEAGCSWSTNSCSWRSPGDMEVIIYSLSIIHTTATFMLN